MFKEQSSFYRIHQGVLATEDSVKGRCWSILYGLTVLDGGIDPQMLGSTPNCKIQDGINPQSDV